MPGPIKEPSRATTAEALRAAAVTDVDELMQSAAALRAQLRTFETALRKVRNHLDRGGTATELHGVLDIIAARETLSKAAAEFQACRHTSRTAIFRVQAAEGSSVGAIARVWGLSRQLVSRTLREDGP